MPKLICLMGPTASGKTEMAMALAERFPFELVSVDSAMIYRGMDIGTAKPSTLELEQFPHHLIDILNPDEVFSAAKFVDLVLPICNEIEQRSKIPLLVGGTSLYFSALQQGLAKLPEKSDEIRQTIEEQANLHGWASLYAELEASDPQAALKIHPKDKQRIQRALEVIRLTGKPLSSYFENTKANPKISYLNLLLMPEDRAWLHQRINQRFDAMLALGFIEEVENLIKTWSLKAEHPSMRTVGYRQAREYIAGDYDYVSFVDKAKAATRQLAKRQLTWLRHWPKGQVFSYDQPKYKQNIIEVIDKILDNPDDISTGL